MNSAIRWVVNVENILDWIIFHHVNMCWKGTRKKNIFLFYRSSIKQAAENNNREQQQKKSLNFVVNWNLCFIRISRVLERPEREWLVRHFLAALCLNQTRSVERERRFFCVPIHISSSLNILAKLNSRPQSKSLRLFQFFASLQLLAVLSYRAWFSCAFFAFTSCFILKFLCIFIYHHRSRVDE